MVEFVQVAYRLDEEDVEKRETKALLEASEEFGEAALTVLTWDEEREWKKRGKVIHVVPVWKWLLSDQPGISPTTM